MPVLKQEIAVGGLTFVSMVIRVMTSHFPPLTKQSRSLLELLCTIHLLFLIRVVSSVSYLLVYLMYCSVPYVL